MTYPEDIMAAAQQLYIALAKTEFQTGILPKGEAACRSGKYDGEQEMQIIAAAIATERARNAWQFTDGEIEKIAKAICAARNDEYNGWENLETSEKDQFIIEAKSAVSVILDAQPQTEGKVI